MATDIRKRLRNGKWTGQGEDGEKLSDLEDIQSQTNISRGLKRDHKKKRKLDKEKKSRANEESDGSAKCRERHKGSTKKQESISKDSEIEQVYT